MRKGEYFSRTSALQGKKVVSREKQRTEVMDEYTKTGTRAARCCQTRGTTHGGKKKDKATTQRQTN